MRPKYIGYKLDISGKMISGFDDTGVETTHNE